MSIGPGFQFGRSVPGADVRPVADDKKPGPGHGAIGPITAR